MADVINLNKARKRRARAEADKRAAQNRLKHGMTRSEREQKRRDAELADRKLDGHRLVRDDPKE